MQHAPNLQLLPGTADTSFSELVAGIKNGVAVMSLRPNMDQQQLNGLGFGQVRKIVDGKLGPYITGAGVQFSGPKLWKAVAALGGAREHRWFGKVNTKGEPSQSTTHSVGAVPARINDVDIIDITHKA
jgi:predicted Zn-dependent protease